MIKVLIVEDDPMVAEINKRYINSVEGFSVIGTVNDGSSAIGFCRKHDVDLAILDIFMPRMDGMQLLSEIRKRFTTIDVIFVTASKEMKHIDEALKLGAVDYLIKPFEYERLKQSLEKYKERYLWMKEKQEVNQNDLDRFIGKSVSERKKLRKGLHEKTLARIRKYLEGKGNLALSSETISDELQISKVTVRRYLDYLEASGEIKKEMVYGTIGRPSFVYRKL